jgi:hypothetical protein
MKRSTILAGGAVATALVLAAGAVTVASAVGAPANSDRVLDDRGVDTTTVSPIPTPSVSHSATAEPGDDNGHDGVVTVPPAGPTVVDRHGDPTAPDDNPGAHDQNGRDDGGHGGDDSGSGQGGHGGDDQGGDDNGGSRHGGDDDR